MTTGFTNSKYCEGCAVDCQNNGITTLCREAKFYNLLSNSEDLTLSEVRMIVDLFRDVSIAEIVNAIRTIATENQC